MADDRWDVMRVVCIKAYETLKVGSHYDIKGRGNLTYNADPNVGGRKGHGYGIEDQNIQPMNTRGFSPTKSIMYYFTEKEMSEYFITEDEDYKMYLRDQKIKSLGIE